MTYVLIILEVIIALLAMDYQKPLLGRIVMIVCLIVIAVILILKRIKETSKSREKDEQLIRIEHYSKDTNKRMRVFAKKLEKAYPENKREAKVLVGLNKILDILAAYNISSVTDNGVGEITIIFDNDFKDRLYDVKVTGNNQNVKHEITEKTEQYLSIKFNEEGLEWLEIICWEK